MFAEGAIVGEYTLQRKLGQGPLAEVWRAKKADRPEPVALKLLRPGALPPSATGRAYERLVAALSETGRLEHPHLPSAVGTVRRPSDGLFGIAVAYYDGGALLDAGDLTNPAALYDALELVIQLGQTVVWLHDRGLVHGSIKPSNVIATPTAEGPAVRLLDLCWSRAGLCRLEGTRFEPPELEEGGPTAASDQWAVARMIRVLVARRAPEPVGAWARVPPDLRQAVDRSLSQDPTQRFERTAELVDAMIAAQVGLSSSAPTYPAAPDGLPAPTVPVEQQIPTTVDPDRVVDNAPESVPIEVTDPNADAPTQPALPDEDQAELRALTGTAKTLDMPAVEDRPTLTDDAVGYIDPSLDADAVRAEPMVRPVVAQDPTDVVPPIQEPEPRRSMALPVIIATAALGAGAVAAWTLLPQKTGADEAVAQSAPPPLAPPPVVPPPVAPASVAPPPPPALPPPEPPVVVQPVEDVPPNAAAPAAPPPAKKPARKRPAKSRLLPRKKTPAQQANLAAKDHAWGECRNGVRQACIALARQHERVKHWRAAARARDEACRQNHRPSCLKAPGHWLRAQEGRVARRRYEKLCDNRVGSACAELSRLYQNGIGGKASQRTANAFRQRACKLGHRKSCQ